MERLAQQIAKRLRQAALGVLAVVGALFLALGLLGPLLILEATGGHDGWLCEWGIDTDGAGTTTSGCG